jgi:predicted site-specific integrase-resolvase
MSKRRRFVPIGDAAQALGVLIATLRRWEESGKLADESVERSEGGQRRYDLAVIRPELFRASTVSRKTIAYARVSSHDLAPAARCCH